MHPTLLTAACLAAWLGLAMAPAAQAGTVLIDNVTLIDAVHGQRDNPKVLMFLALSGGGSRAAYLSAATMFAMQTRLEADLLAEVDVTKT